MIRHTRLIAIGVAGLMGLWMLFVMAVTHHGPLTAADGFVLIWATASVLGFACTCRRCRRPRAEALGAAPRRESAR